MYYVPDYKLEPKAPKFYHLCMHCDNEIYEGETIYDIEDVIVCEDCISCYVEKFKCVAGEEF